MTSGTMTQNRSHARMASDAPRTPDLDPVIQTIIQKARRTIPRPMARGSLGLSWLSALLLFLSFPPVNWSACGWIAPVPLMLLIRLPRPTRLMYLTLYTGGAAFFLAAFQWMRLGDVSMYPAWIALAMYLAVYFPLFVGLSRTAVQRFRIPLLFAAPVVWVGLEFVRAHLMTGVAWYYLAHTQYRWIELIQVSDLAGAYTVSFLMCVSAAALSQLIPVRFFERLRLVLPTDRSSLYVTRRSMLSGVLVVLAMLMATLAYGYVRRQSVAFEPGPRVALIQGNFTSSIKHDPRAAQDIFNEHYMLSMAAVQKGSPEIIIWPETMFRNPLFEVDPELSDSERRRIAPEIPAHLWQDDSARELLRGMSQEMNAALVIGLESVNLDRDGVRRFNSSSFITPDQGVTGRYDKMHRVPFGEYVPLREELPFLESFSPFGPDFGLAAGRRAVVFGYGRWKMTPVICFEDTVPHLVRGIIASTRDAGTGRDVDCLINQTNDGWFHGSSELDQHLITAAFRCIECRVPMVRAVNTGISAVIDGDGVIREPELYIDGDQRGRDTLHDPETGRWRKQISAALVDQVPLDPRSSFYLQTGDLFAGSCGLSCLLLTIGGFLPRRRNPTVDCQPDSISVG